MRFRPAQAGDYSAGVRIGAAQPDGTMTLRQRPFAAYGRETERMAEGYEIPTFAA